jgi:hypothetical protein
MAEINFDSLKDKLQAPQSMPPEVSTPVDPTPVVREVPAPQPAQVASESTRVQHTHAGREARTDLVQYVLDALCEKYGVSNIDASFFGDFAKGVKPSGYLVQRTGTHTFFVNAGNGFNKEAAIALLHCAGGSLKPGQSVQIPATYRVAIEGREARALKLTELDLRSLSNTLPEYRFGYDSVDSEIGALKVVVEH